MTAFKLAANSVKVSVSMFGLVVVIAGKDAITVIGFTFEITILLLVMTPWFWAGVSSLTRSLSGERTSGAMAASPGPNVVSTRIRSW